MQARPTLIHPSFKLIECLNGVQVINPNIQTFKNSSASSTKTIYNLQRLPYLIYFLNTESAVVSINETTAIANGFYSEDDAKGKTASNITTNENAIKLMLNDKEVMMKNQLKFIDETFKRNDGFLVNSISTKIPWYDTDNKILGIFGFSMLGNAGPKYAAYIAKTLGLNNTASKLEQLALTIIEAKIDHLQLTARQTECMYFLIRGKSAKEIGKILNLSFRTIETYLDNIKHKLKCQSTAELIEKAIDSGFANIKLTSQKFTTL